MSQYWVNFIATGNPNGPGLPDWPAADANRHDVMELGTLWHPIALASPEHEAFLRRFLAAQKSW